MARARKKKSATKKAPGIAFNHAMIYVQSVGPAMAFYSALGFRLIAQFPGYARLRAPKGDSTIALHQIGGEITTVDAVGVRLYFEVKNLDAVCERLIDAGIEFKKFPADMPWGWRHAYLNDPDGHEVSLYWAGKKRLHG